MVHFKQYQEYFATDNYAAMSGIKLTNCKPGYARAEVTIEKKHLNGAKVVHGGLIFTLADFVFAAAVNAYGLISLSINASISFHEKCTSGTIVAEAKEIARSRKLSNYDINVYDENNRLIANFKGTAYITKTNIEF
ncbi:MAG: PaaI family thioesterase [Bacteroidales bacterium]|nr:PaaI family thioesterase [Bacteroidales bacterium]